MNIDSHYYGTYYIAREAGWSHEDAKKIAWAAQTVDELYMHVLVKKVYNNYKKEDDKSLMPRVITILLPKALSKWDVDGKYVNMYTHNNLYSYAYRYLIMFTWMPFHFLPEMPSSDSNDGIPDMTSNPIYQTLSDKEKSDFKKLENFYQEDYKLICKTSTNLCKAMINEARRIYAGPFDSEEQRNQALFRIGICMHVLADTWSHQGFCGNGDVFINTGERLENFGNFESDSGTIMVGGFSSWYKEDCPFSSTWGGHGSVGHNPDVPARKYIYFPSYMISAGNQNLHKYNAYVDNPTRFLKAFYQMLTALVYIKNENLDQFYNFEARFDDGNYMDLDKIPAWFNLPGLDPDCNWVERITNPIECSSKTIYQNLRFIFENTNKSIEKCEECTLWKQLLGVEEDGSCLSKLYDLPEYQLEDESDISKCGQDDANADSDGDNYNKLKVFLKSAQEHRNFIMERAGYADKIVVIDSIIKQLLNGVAIDKIDKNGNKVKELGTGDVYAAWTAHDSPSSSGGTQMSPGGSTTNVAVALNDGSSNTSGGSYSTVSSGGASTNSVSSNVAASNDSKLDVNKFNIGNVYCNSEVGGNWESRT